MMAEDKDKQCFQNDLVIREKKELEERKRRQEQEEENKYDFGIIKSYKNSKGKNGPSQKGSKRNLNNLSNGKGKKMSGTPNYE